MDGEGGGGAGLRPHLLGRYAYSLHWAVVTTLGNDSGPTNHVQYTFAAFVVISGMLLEAAVVGSLAALILNLDHHHNAYNAHIIQLLGYLNHFSVPTEITKRVISSCKPSVLQPCTKAMHYSHAYSRLLNTIPYCR